MEFPVYCEQPISNGFFEPFNTITNLAFIIVGGISIIRLKNRNLLDLKGIYFSCVLIAIGIGSFLWHLHRTNVNLMLDSIPIAIFVLSFLFFYLKLITSKISGLIIFIVAFLIYTPALTSILNKTELSFFMNGGAGYFSAVTYLILLQVLNYFKKSKIIKRSVIIVLVFLLSLSFRQVDSAFCEETLHIGTHFMWHIFNTLTLFMMINLFYYNKTN